MHEQTSENSLGRNTVPNSPVTVQNFGSYNQESVNFHAVAFFGANVTINCYNSKCLKLKLRVFLAGHSVALVTYCVTKIMPMCSPVIEKFFDTMIVAPIDKERL